MVKPASAPPPAKGRRRGLGLTRALTLIAVLAILSLSYARSLTVYLSQQRDIAAVQAANDARRAEISRLEDEAARWSDPDYVRAQARARLGWVLPGEIGYRVITADGTILGVEPVPSAQTQAEAGGAWYDQLWSSIKSADQPFSAESDQDATAPSPGAAETPG